MTDPWVSWLLRKGVVHIRQQMDYIQNRVSESTV